MTLRINVFLLTITPLWLSACGSPAMQEDLGSPNPAAKIPAMRTAVSDPQDDSLQKLVLELRSDDSAIRFYAISALQRIAGEAKGYVYYADETERLPAVEQWELWLKERSQ